MREKSCGRRQRGIAPVVIVIIVVLVVAVVIGAIVVATAPPATPSTPPPGCFPAGTQCRVFIQNEVSCCGGQQVVGKQNGACFGWWDGIPCVGGAGMNEGAFEQRLVALGGRTCAAPMGPTCAAAQVDAPLR